MPPKGLLVHPGAFYKASGRSKKGIFIMAWFLGYISSPVLLKVMFYTCPFHYAIGNMADADFSVYSYRQIGYRAIPDIMIAFAMPYQVAAIFF